MDVLMVPRAEVRQVLVDLETFLDLGLWGYLYQAMAELEEILGEDAISSKKNENHDFST
ncbi:hypothetical protein Cva_00545 [Caedimonas varicaedens]|uniref:Uncharacterized protein n=1 Tax=Caedimonas varicaedens TaxID=1629334 RepID=A0A0K8MDD7_9PROT|nr:hypothetical protein Cva_00545 [Caedimonas varicaedens]